MEAYAFASWEMDPETYVVAVVCRCGGAGIRSDGPGRADVTNEEAEEWLAEKRELGARGDFFMSSTQFCFAASKAHR